MNARKKINSILAEWNPIGVPDNIAESEYTAYIPLVMENIHNREALRLCLMDILTNKMGIEVDEPIIAREILDVCEKIIKIKQ